MDAITIQDFQSRTGRVVLDRGTPGVLDAEDQVFEATPQGAVASTLNLEEHVDLFARSAPKEVAPASAASPLQVQLQQKVLQAIDTAIVALRTAEAVEKALAAQGSYGKVVLTESAMDQLFEASHLAAQRMMYVVNALVDYSPKLTLEYGGHPDYPARGYTESLASQFYVSAGSWLGRKSAAPGTSFYVESYTFSGAVEFLQKVRAAAAA